MKYVNKVTKAVITTNGEISGGDWEEFKDFIEETAVEEPEGSEAVEKAPAKKTKGKKDAK